MVTVAPWRRIHFVEAKVNERPSSIDVPVLCLNKGAQEDGSDSTDAMRQGKRPAAGAGGGAREELFSEADLIMEWRTLKDVGAGLQNLGNTCFMNSVLQCLAHTPPLAELLLSGQVLHSRPARGFDPLGITQALLAKLLRQRGRVVSPVAHARTLKNVNRSFRFGRQEDAHEYLIALVDAMHESSIAGLSPKPPPALAQTSFIYRIFGGRMRSTVRCTECGYESCTLDPCIDLSLEINHASTLHKALQRFTQREVLDGGNKYKCPRQKRDVRAVKRMTLDAVPAVLMVQLKRFEFSLSGHKISKKVDFETELDLTPYMSSKPLVAPLYELYAVLCHSGHSVHSGHYFCYVRGAAGMWFLCDDAHVSQVSERVVLAQKAYILFYIRRQPRPGASGGRPAAAARPAATPSSRPGVQQAAEEQPGARPRSAAGVQNGIGDTAAAVQHAQQEQQGARSDAAPDPAAKRRRVSSADHAPAAANGGNAARVPAAANGGSAALASPAAAEPGSTPQYKIPQQQQQQQQQQQSEAHGRMENGADAGEGAGADAEPHTAPRPRHAKGTSLALPSVHPTLGRRRSRLAEQLSLRRHAKPRAPPSAGGGDATSAGQAQPQQRENSSSTVAAPAWPPTTAGGAAAAAPGADGQQQLAMPGEQGQGPSARKVLERLPFSKVELAAWDGAAADTKRLHDRLLRQAAPRRKRVDDWDLEYDRGKQSKRMKKAQQ